MVSLAVRLLRLEVTLAFLLYPTGKELHTRHTDRHKHSLGHSIPQRAEVIVVCNSPYVTVLSFSPIGSAKFCPHPTAMTRCYSVSAKGWIFHCMQTKHTVNYSSEEGRIREDKLVPKTSKRPIGGPESKESHGHIASSVQLLVSPGPLHSAAGQDPCSEWAQSCPSPSC